jgi:Ca-activated chloride channel family protein
MKFARLEMLFLVWVLPVLVLAYLYGWRKRRTILSRFAVARTLSVIVPGGMAARRLWAAILILSATLLAVVAMAGPQYGFQWQTVERRGVDIIIALDCSRSMLAADIAPNRLDRAKREIYDLLNMLQGDRVGLIAFSGTAFLQCPLTIDYSAFNLFLEVLTPDYLPLPGTDLFSALKTCLSAFDPDTPSEKAVILITDGEHTGSENPLKAAEQAQKAGIKLFCIGVGSGDGVPIPAEGGGFKKDASGRIILSHLDESLLTRMALATGGGYVRSAAGDMDLDTIYRDQIRGQMEATTVESSRKQVWADRFQWPLALAVLLLFVARWMPVIKKPLGIVLIALALSTFHPKAWAGPLQEAYQAYQKGDYPQALKKFIDEQLKDPENPEILYNIGNTHYKNKDYAAADKHYAQALTKAPADLKPKLMYNLGNSAYRQGRLEEAVKHYEAALKLAPQDQETQENLAFVKQKLQQENQKQQQQEQEQEQEQKNPSDEAQKSQSKQQEKPPSSQNQKQDQKEPEKQPDEKKEPPGQKLPPDPSHSEANEAPKPENPTEPPEKQDSQASAGAQPKNEQPGERPASTQILNRLKDQPGRALMPQYEKHPVDKDW